MYYDSHTLLHYGMLPRSQNALHHQNEAQQIANDNS